VFPLANRPWTPHSTAFFSSFAGTSIRRGLPPGPPRVTSSSVRHKSIFQHRWFHPEPNPGEPPRESFRVFWTVSALLLGFSGVYVYYIDPWVTEKWRASPIAGFTKPKGEPVFDKDNFFPYVIKHTKDYNHNTKLCVRSLYLACLRLMYSGSQPDILYSKRRRSQPARSVCSPHPTC